MKELLLQYLTVKLLVQLADALSQLSQLLSDYGMMDSLSCVRLHVKAFVQEIRIALCKQSSMSLQSPSAASSRPGLILNSFSGSLH